MSSAADEVLETEEPGDRRRTPEVSRPDLRFALKTVLALAAVGAALGWPWQYWSPRTIALVYNSSGLVAQESEAFIAGDGRFVIITGCVGLLAGTAAWFVRRRRGPVVPAGLAVGGAAGAYLTALVGRVGSGGTTNGQIGTIIRPPVQLHAVNLLAVEPLIAVLVYLLCTLFAAEDDLGRSLDGV